MFLHRQDCPSYEGTYWTQRHLHWIKAASLDPVDRETCDKYLMMVKELQDRLDRQLYSAPLSVQTIYTEQGEEFDSPPKSGHF